MARIVSKHTKFEAADPNRVIVTLYTCEHGDARGWYVGPPSLGPRLSMAWRTSPEDRLLAPVALVRAIEIAQALNLDLCVVDPENLWDEIHGIGGGEAG